MKDKVINEGQNIKQTQIIKSSDEQSYTNKMSNLEEKVNSGSIHCTMAQS